MENRFEWMRRHFSRIIVWLVFVITYIVMIIVSALIHMTYSEITFARPLAENMEWVLCFVVPTILLFILFDRYTLFIVNISNRIYKTHTTSTHWTSRCVMPCHRSAGTTRMRKS